MSTSKFNVQKFFFHFKKNIKEKLESPETKKEIVSLVRDVVVIVGVVHVVTNYAASVTLCVGPSMLPTFDTKGDFVLVDQYSKHFSPTPYQIGDVILAKSPGDAKKSKFFIIFFYLFVS